MHPLSWKLRMLANRVDLPPDVRYDLGRMADKLEEPITLAHSEERQIRLELQRQKGNCSLTASVLGVSRNTLHRRMAEAQARGEDLRNPAPNFI